MYYKHISQLPKQIRQSLPLHAQETYLNSFNKAWEQYKDDESLPTNQDRESTSHRLAWETVTEQKLGS